MGFRAGWLENATDISVHYEVFLHAIEREVPDSRLDVLLVGVGNGGDIAIWRDVLPEGSTVTAIDSDPLCGTLESGVLVGDPFSKSWLLEALGRQQFDVVIWTHTGVPETIWPWIRSGGRLVIEGLWQPSVKSLAASVASDEPTWLPSEEIMRVTVYPHVTVVEKRDPRVLPYIRIMTGNFANVIPEADLVAEGVKRVLVE